MFFKICNFTAEQTSNKIMIWRIEKFNFLFNFSDCTLNIKNVLHYIYHYSTVVCHEFIPGFKSK